MDRVRLWWDAENYCYDLAVIDREANVADYEQAAGQVLSEPEAYRKYSDTCINCSICCGGRLSLTAIDVFRLQAGGLGAGLSLPDWVGAHASVQRQDGCIDIVLRIDRYETCRLWDRWRRMCKVYENRPFVCRTYLCAPMTRRLAELRSQIVNAGEDELVRLTETPEVMATGETGPFAGAAGYDQVLLQQVCSGRLWHHLTNHQ